MTAFFPGVARLFPLGSFTAKNLDRKTKLLLQLLHPTYLGRENLSDPTSIPPPISVQLLDAAIGFACSSMVILNKEALFSSSWVAVEAAIVTTPLMVVNWLNNWPVGLKLNTELSKFFFQTFLVVISSWIYWLPRVFEIAFYGFSCLGFLGASVLVTFAADIVQVATLHLCICDIIATAAIHALMLYASTLWNLFHGKCYNQLCNRSDRWPYETDHLVLGTIFFTLATFLMPTIFTYYVFFSVIANILYVFLYAFDKCYKFL